MYVEYRKKVQMNLVPGQEQRHKRTERMCGHGEWEGGMNWEIRFDIDTPCGKERASGKLVYHKELSSVLCGDLEGWGGGEAQKGGDPHTQLIHAVAQQKLTEQCKASILQ